MRKACLIATVKINKKYCYNNFLWVLRCYRRLKETNVLDLWFRTVYETKGKLYLLLDNLILK